MKYINFPIVIEHDADGYFAFCPELQGCYTQGTTYEEVMANIKDAIKLHMEDPATEEEMLDRKNSISISMVEVAV
jgi:predicted RNase H-like HicB family nuclease